MSGGGARRRHRALLLPLLLAGGAAALQGCAPTASTAPGRGPERIEAAPRQAAGAVRVEASGGCDGCGLGQARISDAAFGEAVAEALRRSGRFARVAREGGGEAVPYLLSVRVFQTDPPVFGMSMRVLFEAGWTLTRSGSPLPLWQESIRSDFTATSADAVLGAERVRLAWEGAARRNIAEGVARLSRLPLPE